MVTVKKCDTIKTRGVLLLGLAALGLLCGCTARQSGLAIDSTRISSASAGGQEYSAPGVVNYVWEEPMVNVVEVPPSLDPEGIYYRPSHQEVVEIRQGRWKYYKDESGK